MMLSYIGKKKIFWGKTVKFCKNHKKLETICSIHISSTFSRCNPIEQNSVIIFSRKVPRLQESSKAPAVISHLNIFGAK